MQRHRLGRMAKYFRRAYCANLCPLALDTINQELLRVSPTVGQSVDAMEDASNQTFAISQVIFDPEDLDASLATMSWNDVDRLRKKILPGVAALRNHLNKRLHEVRRKAAGSPELFVDELEKLKMEYSEMKGNLALEYEKLRIAAISKGRRSYWGGFWSATTVPGR